MSDLMHDTILNFHSQIKKVFYFSKETRFSQSVQMYTIPIEMLMTRIFSIELVLTRTSQEIFFYGVVQRCDKLKFPTI
jgi:hypothetical protein